MDDPRIASAHQKYQASRQQSHECRRMLQMRRAETVKAERAIIRFKEFHKVQEAEFAAVLQAQIGGKGHEGDEDSVLQGLLRAAEALKPGVDESIEEVRLLNGELLETQCQLVELRKANPNPKMPF